MREVDAELMKSSPLDLVLCSFCFVLDFCGSVRSVVEPACSP
jgi:hypothetical protein